MRKFRSIALSVLLVASVSGMALAGMTPDTMDVTAEVEPTAIVTVTEDLSWGPFQTDEGKCIVADGDGWDDDWVRGNSDFTGWYCHTAPDSEWLFFTQNTSSHGEGTFHVVSNTDVDVKVQWDNGGWLDADTLFPIHYQDDHPDFSGDNSSTFAYIANRDFLSTSNVEPQSHTFLVEYDDVKEAIEDGASGAAYDIHGIIYNPNVWTVEAGSYSATIDITVAAP